MGRRARIVLLLCAALAGLGAAGAQLLRGGRETTDDAQVEGHVINVSTRVAGQVRRVLVQDDQLVEEGAVLVELDTSDLEARVAAARADRAAARADRAAARAALAAAQAQAGLVRKSASAGLRQARGALRQARSGRSASDSQTEQARAELAAAQARRDLAQRELQRTELLRSRGAAAPVELDTRRAQMEQAQAALAQAEARLRQSGAGIDASDAALDVAGGRLAAALTVREQRAAAAAQADLAAARLDQAEAALRLAELHLSYAVVRAPVRGVVSRRSVEVGGVVSPERPLLSLVPPDDVWIVAHFKEDQLAALRPGQPADVRLDTYGRRVLRGRVASIAGATGARFSLLPPDNATGNYVKVTQRVTVTVRLDPPLALPLRPGMSALVAVQTE